MFWSNSFASFLVRHFLCVISCASFLVRHFIKLWQFRELDQRFIFYNDNFGNLISDSYYTISGTLSSIYIIQFRELYHRFILGIQWQFRELDHRFMLGIQWQFRELDNRCILYNFGNFIIDSYYTISGTWSAIHIRYTMTISGTWSSIRMTEVASNMKTILECKPSGEGRNWSIFHRRTKEKEKFLDENDTR
jgi:hypothetical protein